MALIGSSDVRGGGEAVGEVNCEEVERWWQNQSANGGLDGGGGKGEDELDDRLGDFRMLARLLGVQLLLANRLLKQLRVAPVLGGTKRLAVAASRQLTGVHYSSLTELLLPLFSPNSKHELEELQE
jgi:hypothetical protein